MIRKYLKSNKVDLPDEMYTILTMKGLPEPRFSMFKGIIKRSKPWPTWSDFKTLLQDEDSTAFSKEAQMDSVMYSNSSNTSQKHFVKAKQKGFVKGKKKPDRFCEFCERSGHLISNCWRKDPSKRPKKSDSVKTVKVQATSRAADNFDSDDECRNFNYMLKCYEIKPEPTNTKPGQCVTLDKNVLSVAEQKLGPRDCITTIVEHETNPEEVYPQMLYPKTFGIINNIIS